MKRTLTILVAIYALMPTSTEAQFKISIPKLPKITAGKVKDPSAAETKETTASDRPTPTPSSGGTDSQSIWDNVKHPGVYSHRDNLKETLKEIQAYTPETKTRVVSYHNYDWLLRSVSPSSRREYLDDWGQVMSPPQRKWFEDTLDQVATTANTKLQLFVGNTSAFPIRNAAEERMMKSQLSDVPGLVVHSIGIATSGWNIEKNALGIPLSRFKYGRIWGRNPKADDPFCRFYFVNIIQPYTGGGTYGASYAKYADTQLAGVIGQQKAPSTSTSKLRTYCIQFGR